MRMRNPAGTTVEGARRALAQLFTQHGIDTPALDARLLVAHALHLDHAGLAAAASRTLSDAERAAVATFAQRRLAAEPVARIVGEKEFWSLPFRLSPDTLVPRPETETAVEAALAVLPAPGAGAPAPRIADLGTGSGALLLAILHERRDAFGIGTDISAGALACAKANAQRLQLASRAAFVACDLSGALRGPLDLVVSNPPYVASAEIAALPPEVRDFDPRRALDGGADGLAFYRRIASEAARLLAPQGALVVELGAGQCEPVSGIMAQAGLAPREPARRDLAGMPRALILRRRQGLGA
ncbi:MAG: peptide chain release factor N(5)-glutamine methyltransferase [Pseudorhodoplanes sp.]